MLDKDTLKRMKEHVAGDVIELFHISDEKSIEERVSKIEKDVEELKKKFMEDK